MSPLGKSMREGSWTKSPLKRKCYKACRYARGIEMIRNGNMKVRKVNPGILILIFSLMTCSAYAQKDEFVPDHTGFPAKELVDYCRIVDKVIDHSDSADKDAGYFLVVSY